MKNSLHARFGPRSGPKDTVFGAFWSFWSLISNDFQLRADFFNRLGFSANFILPGFHEPRLVRSSEKLGFTEFSEVRIAPVPSCTPPDDWTTVFPQT